MVADFMTKPLQGSHFRHLRDYIMGRVCNRKPKKEAVQSVLLRRTTARRRSLLSRATR